MARSKTTSSRYPAVTPLFEWLYVFFSSWFLGGLFFDAWSHTHHPELETFFNVPHSVLYSGFVVLATLIFSTAYANWRRGFPIKRSMPAGYQTALWGACVFLVAGTGDMFWHIFLGIEHQLEAAFSPTHIGIMIGLTILLAAPLMSAWRRGEKLSFSAAKLPATLSFANIFLSLTLVTQWAHPFVVQVAAIKPIDVGDGQALGILGIILQTAILVSLMLLVIRRGIAHPGIFTTALVINTFVLSLMQGTFEMIPVALVGGLFADIALAEWQDHTGSIFGLRVMAVTVPAVLYSAYFIALFAIRHVWWSIHMWAGAIVVAAIFGLLTSYVVIPPADHLAESKA